jgi:putative ABC transport system permease protein
VTRFFVELQRATRLLLRKPAFLIVAGTILTFGIGITVFMFGAIDAFMLRPLPFPNAERLVYIDCANPELRQRNIAIRDFDLADIQARSTTLESVAGFYEGTINLSGNEQPERFDGGFVTPGTFSTLGVRPLLGRDFHPDEGKVGGAPVLLLGYELWQMRYSGRPDIVGASVRVNGEPATVVGVMPEGFRFPFRAQVWTARSPDPTRVGRTDFAGFLAFGRYRADSSRSAVDSELKVLYADLARTYPDTNRGYVPAAHKMYRMYVDEGMSVVLYTMLATVFLVMLIACSNVASLSLVRAVLRTRELAIRSALGAARSQIVLTLIGESAVIVLISGILGTVLASKAGNLVLGYYCAKVNGMPPWIHADVNWRTALFATTAAFIAMIVAGLLPALRASSANLLESLRAGGRGLAGSPLGRTSRWMVAAEIALAVVVLTCAGLQIRSIKKMANADVGVNAHNILTGRIRLAESRYPTDESCGSAVSPMVAALAALPGARSATATTALPGGGTEATAYELEGEPVPTRLSYRVATYASIAESYLQTFDVKLRAGREFAASDDARALRVAIVNEMLARQYGRPEAIVGRRIRQWSFSGRPPGPWLTIVGVVPTILQDAIRDGFMAGIYVPLSQEPSRYFSIALRTQGAPMALAQDMRRAVAGLDPDLPVYFVESLEERIAQGRFVPDFLAWTFTGFAIIGLLLAAAGLYAVLAFEVNSQTAEIGVRRALGASTGRVVQTVLARHGKVFLGALAAGLVATVFFAQLLVGDVLVDVGAFDALTYTSVAVVLAVAALLAVAMPCRRAVRIDPAVALRYE